ncbi:hypothetical protein, partial [Leptospira interrogans]|uniref:hypothetical protein n=1 Tax=Leptospira interrogans TaxID=173 RepID=UPI000A4C3431
KYIKSKINSIWSYVKKITGGLDTRNIGESRCVEFGNSEGIFAKSAVASHFSYEICERIRPDFQPPNSRYLTR